MGKEELLEVVDEQNRVVGRASRDEIHRRNLMHRSVHVLLINSQGKLFLQKRAQAKDRYPLRCDSSAAGHLNIGESYDECAYRELKEELGISGAPLLEIANFKACEQTGWEHISLFLCHTDEQVRINPEEIAEGRFLALEEVAALIEEAPTSFTPDFRLLFHWFMHSKDCFKGLIKDDC